MAITQQQQDAIAEQWRNRATAHDLKPGTKRYTDAQTHFIAGACSALHNTDPVASNDRLSSLIPPRWIIGPLSGRDPFTA